MRMCVATVILIFVIRHSNHITRLFCFQKPFKVHNVLQRVQRKLSTFQPKTVATVSTFFGSAKGSEQFGLMLNYFTWSSLLHFLLLFLRVFWILFFI